MIIFIYRYCIYLMFISLFNRQTCIGFRPIYRSKCRLKFSTAVNNLDKEIWKIPRVYQDNLLNIGESHILDEETSHYILNVMRLKPQDKFRMFNSIQGEYLVQFNEVLRKKGVSVNVVEKIREISDQTGTNTNGLPINLIFAPLKKNYMKLLIEKSTELGVGTLTPLITHRTINDIETASIYRRNVIESCETCERLIIPDLLDSINLKTIIKKYPMHYDILFQIFNVSKFLICSERNTNTIPILTALENWDIETEKIAIIVGPEGGFSPEEHEYFKQFLEYDKKRVEGDNRLVQNVFLVSLGNNIMRAETAGIYSLSCAAGYYEKRKNTLFS